MTAWLNSKPPCFNTSCLVFNWRKKQKKTAQHKCCCVNSQFSGSWDCATQNWAKEMEWQTPVVSITPSEFLTLQTLFSHHGRVWKNKLCLIFFIIWVQIWDPKEFSRFYNCTWHLASISLIESLQPYLINSFHLISSLHLIDSLNGSLSLEILASKQNFSISSPHV